MAQNKIIERPAARDIKFIHTIYLPIRVRTLLNNHVLAQTEIVSMYIPFSSTCKYFFRDF